MTNQHRIIFSISSKLKKRILAVTSLTIVIVAGSACTWWVAISEDRHMRQNLLTEVRLIAKAIDSQCIQNLSGSPTDINSPVYQRLKEQLTLVRSAKPQCRFLYLMGQRQDGTMFFFVDSEPSDSNDYSPPGQVFEEVTDGLRYAFATTRECIEGPVTDQWGTWISSLVPLTDSRTGKIVAVLGADIDAKRWKTEIAVRCATPVLIALLLVTLLTGFFMVQRLTEQNLAKEALRENEGRFRAIFNNQMTGIVIIDASTHLIVDVNSACARLIGAPKEKIVGCLCHQFICPAEKGKCPITDLGKTVDNAERVLLTVNRVSIPIIKTVSKALINKREYLIETFSDITERKQTEEALQKSEQQYRTLFNEAIDGICVADAETGVIIDCNDALARLVGRSRDELIGQHQKILHPPSERQDAQFSDTFQQHLTDKQGQLLDAQVITKDGQIRDVEIKANCVHLLGRKALLGMFRDVTERKKTERLIDLANAKLSESNKQLQEFAYIISHDLREPTRKITAFGQLLVESLYDKLNDEEKENLQFMIDGADRMQQMVEAVLEYSRITTRGAAFKPVDLNQIVEQLKGFELAMTIEETKASVLVPEPLPSVMADATQVRQLLQNLIANAIKYRRQNTAPEIIISARPTQDSMIRVNVQDNGIGIKPEFLGNLFVMFRQLHKRGEYEGMGIGLAICKRIVERHGGQIGVESVYGQGSTFWFTLLAAELPATPRPTASARNDQADPSVKVSKTDVHAIDRSLVLKHQST